MLHSLLPLSASLPADHVREEIPRGQAGTAATIARMIRVAQHGKRDDRIRQLCGRVIENCSQKDYYCYAKSIHDFVTHKIKYAYDPVDVELVESAWNVVKNGIADCDSKCGLFAAMCEQVGLPVQFVTVKGNPSSNEFTHVYCRVQIPKRGWVASDTTMPNKPFGWEPKGLPEKTWDVSSEDAFNMDAFTCDSLSGGVVAMQTGVDASSLYGMSGLGDNDTVISILTGMADGSTYNMLRRMKDESNTAMEEAGKILNRANNIVDPSARSQAMTKYTNAQAAVTKARRSLFQAIAKYNELAQAMQTYSNGAVKPQQLGALGLAPAVIAALAGVGLVANLALGLALLIPILRNDNGAMVQVLREGQTFVAQKSGVNTTNVLDTLSDKFNPTKLVEKFGTFAVIGGGFLLVAMALKKKW